MIIGQPAFKDHETNEKLSCAWVRLALTLDCIYGWNWFVTLTFRDDNKSPEGASKSFMLWIHQLNRSVFGVRYTYRKQGCAWLRATENHKNRRVVHYHCLIGNGVQNARRLTWMDKWNELEGFARILPYDAERGAAFYISKYMAKGGEIDLDYPMCRAPRQDTLNLPTRVIQAHSS